MGVKDTFKKTELTLGGYDYNVVIILGGAADERYAAYVDFLDDIVVACARSNCCLEGVEVYDD